MRWAIVGSGDEERARDLLGGQAAEQAQRQRDARLGRQHRMAGDEDQPQQVVADVVVEGASSKSGVDGVLRRLHVVADLFVLAIEHLAAAEVIDGPVLGGGHQPGARVARDARRRATAASAATSASCARSSARPMSRTTRVDAGDELRRLDPPDRVDRAMRLGGLHGHDHA